MSENALTLPDNHALEIPAFGKSPALSFDMTSTQHAFRRLIEAKNVNPSTYSELEHIYNESYRELKRYVSQIGYQLMLAQKALNEAEADVILGSYAEFMQGKPKYQDNANLRNAFITKDPMYTAAYERLAQLKALESHFEGKIKVLENVCRYMRKKMDLVLRTGMGGNIYPTQG
jgi:hypothetical protein